MNDFLRLRFSCALLLCTTVSTQGSDCRAACQNGVCEENTGRCRCGAGWTGDACDVCAAPGQCACARGWTGARCDRDMRLCSSKPCCVEEEDGHRKTGPCPTDSPSCQNGGTCVDTRSCLCPSGFTGTFCEIEVDVCDPNPCENGGVCNRLDLTFTCVCPPAFSGPVCSFTLCSSSRCVHGGTCFNHTDGRIGCFCPPGFTGSSCELHINKFKSKSRFKAAGRLTIPTHTFHKLLQPPESEFLKSTLKETQSQTQSQIICLAVLGLLTCLVVLVTTGIVFLNRCETWMTNMRYSQMLHQQRDFLLRVNDSDEHTVHIILPEKIKLRNYEQHYTTI